MNDSIYTCITPICKYPFKPYHHWYSLSGGSNPAQWATKLFSLFRDRAIFFIWNGHITAITSRFPSINGTQTQPAQQNSTSSLAKIHQFQLVLVFNRNDARVECFWMGYFHFTWKCVRIIFEKQFTAISLKLTSIYV